MVGALVWTLTAFFFFLPFFLTKLIQVLVVRVLGLGSRLQKVRLTVTLGIEISAGTLTQSNMSASTGTAQFFLQCRYWQFKVKFLDAGTHTVDTAYI